MESGQTKFPYYDEIDQADKNVIVDACKLFFGENFDKIATVVDDKLSYNGYNRKDLMYYLKDSTRLLDFTITFLSYSKRDRSVQLLPIHGEERADYTIPAQILLSFLKDGTEHGKTIRIDGNITVLLGSLFNPGVPDDYIAQYDGRIAHEKERLRALAIKRYDEEAEIKKKADEIYRATVEFISQQMETVILSNYQQVLTNVKQNNHIAPHYNVLTDEQR